jgi:methyl-accepting chemotaxis protein
MFENMKIGARLGLGFGVVLLMLAGVGLLGYWGVRSVAGTTSIMLRGDAPVAKHAAQALTNVIGLRRYEKDIYLNIGSMERMEEYYGKWRKEYENLTVGIREAETAATVQKDRESLQSMKTELAAYRTGFNKVYTLILTGKIKTAQQANYAIEGYKDRIHEMEQAAKDLVDESNQRMDAQEEVIKSRVSRTNTSMLALVLLAILFTVVLSILTTRSTTRGVREAISVVEKVASASRE